ncbi:unnamed protein product, partial [Hymenolepis diminuta]
VCEVHNANKTDWITCTRTHHGKCGHVTGHVEIKRDVCAETCPTNQQSRSRQPSMVLCLMTKLLRKETRKWSRNPLHSTSYRFLPFWA